MNELRKDYDKKIDEIKKQLKDNEFSKNNKLQNELANNVHLIFH